MATEADPASEWTPPGYDPDRLDVYLGRRGGGGGAVYIALLLLVSLAIVALPLVQVPLSLRARGHLRSDADAQTLLAPIAGVAIRVIARDVHQVGAGDTIVLLDRPELRVREGGLRSRRTGLEEELRDLLLLIDRADHALAGGAEPLSLRYAEELRAFRSEAGALEMKLEAAEREAARAAALLGRELVSASEVDLLRDRVEQLRYDADLQRTRAAARWRAELASVQEALRVVGSEEAALVQELSRLAIVAPVSGTIDDLAAISAGSFVAAGERIASVTPESELVAELYLTPEQLGSIAVGTPVRLHLESFRFSEWGAVEGHVIEISPQLERIGSQSVGRVRVRPVMTEAPGPRGAVALRRGVSVSARMPKASRSLWALLRSRRDSYGALAPTPAAALESPAG